MNIYKANIIYTPTSDEFRYLQGGYVCVAANGVVDGVYERLPEEIKDYSFTDFGDRLLIPAFNDLHIHAPQYRNLCLALDEELACITIKVQRCRLCRAYLSPFRTRIVDAGYDAEQCLRHRPYRSHRTADETFP